MALILVLDDSPTMILSLSRMLKGEGYEVETAANGQEGLGKLAAGLKPNLILTDLNMPQMDGLAFIKEARKSPAARFIPILVLTTESSAEKKGEVRAAGASGWLSKPTEPNVLISALKKLLP